MDHEFYMQQALALAREAAAHGEVPVGCVIVRDGRDHRLRAATAGRKSSPPPPTRRWRRMAQANEALGTAGGWTTATCM